MLLALASTTPKTSTSRKMKPAISPGGGLLSCAMSFVLHLITPQVAHQAHKVAAVEARDSNRTAAGLETQTLAAMPNVKHISVLHDVLLALEA